MGHRFFLSYASADARNGGDALEWFYTTLYQRLNIMHHEGEASPAERGFMAATTIEPAANWRAAALPRALNESHVLVCLYSNNYFRSEYCGKEFDAFLRRRRLFIERVGGEPPDCIVPVIWQPPTNPVPRTLPDFHWTRFDGSRFPAEVGGLFEAYDNPAHRDMARVFVHQLAKRIANLLQVNTGRNQLPPLPNAPDVDSLDNAFASPQLPLQDLDDVKASGTRAVTIVYPSEVTPDEWPFGPPVENSAVVCTAAIARSREMSIQGVEFVSDADSDAVVNRVARVVSSNTPVVLVLTPKALGNRPLMRRFAGLKPDGVATLIVNRENARLDPSVLQELRGQDRFHGSLSSAADLDAAIRRCLAALRANLGGRGGPPVPGSGPSILPTL